MVHTAWPAGKPTPFPVPMATPDVSDGFSFNIVNNMWGTNYVMVRSLNERIILMRQQFPLQPTAFIIRFLS